MHEATQRRLVRTTFVLTCLVPTLAVVGWAIAWRLDSHVTRLQRRLSQQLGVNVRATQVSHPRPNIARIERVRLLDPETNEQLAWLDQLDLVERSDELTMVVSRATVDAAKMRRLGQLTRARISHQVASSKRGKLLCETLEVVDDADREVLHQVTATSRSLISSVEASVSFALSQQDTAPRVELAIVRDRRQTPWQTRVELDTHGAAVPVGVFCQAAKHRLGADAVFRGTCQAAYQPDGQWYRMVASGLLERVDSGRWIVEPIPYRLTGQGRIELTRLEMGRGGIEQAVGRLRIEQGSIDSDLLQSLANPQYGLVTLDPPIDLTHRDNEPFVFRDLAVEVRLDVKGLTIRAPRAEVTLDPTPRPLAMGQDGKTILEPTYILPVDHLVLAIVPHHLDDADQIRNRLQQILPRPAPRLFRISRQQR